MCKACESGKYASGEGNKECHCVRVGNEPNAGKTAQDKCKPGFYQDDACQDACVQCQPGRFQNTSGSVNCMCASKGHSVNEDFTGEVECPRGYYASKECQAECHKCARSWLQYFYDLFAGPPDCNKLYLPKGKEELDKNSS